MFDLFKPPRFQIRKRVPTQALAAFTAIEAIADKHFLQLDSTQGELATAYVLSVWMCNAAELGEFELSQFDFRYIKNSGLNSARMMAPATEVITGALLGVLVEKGLVLTVE